MTDQTDGGPFGLPAMGIVSMILGVAFWGVPAFFWLGVVLVIGGIIFLASFGAIELYDFFVWRPMREEHKK